MDITRLPCGGRRLVTNKLEEASEWILDNVAGLVSFQLILEVHSEQFDCIIACSSNKPDKKTEKADSQLSLWIEE
jgi:hypothetical protein